MVSACVISCLSKQAHSYNAKGQEHHIESMGVC